MTQQADWEAKVHKLLAKAGSTANVIERELFEKKAYELIAEHQVDMSKPVEEQVTIVNRDFTAGGIPGIPGTWPEFLASAARQFAGTFLLVSKLDARKQLYLFDYWGEARIVDISLRVFADWQSQLIAECKAQASIAYQDGFIRGKYNASRTVPVRKMWQRQFMLVACTRLYNRIYEMQQVIDESTLAIVLCNKDAYADAARNAGNDYGEGKPPRYALSFRQAGLAGLKAANNIRLVEELSDE